MIAMREEGGREVTVTMIQRLMEISNCVQKLAIYTTHVHTAMGAAEVARYRYGDKKFRHLVLRYCYLSKHLVTNMSSDYA